MSSAGLQRLLGQPDPITAHHSVLGGECQRIIPCLTSVLTPPSHLPPITAQLPAPVGCSAEKPQLQSATTETESILSLFQTQALQLESGLWRL